MKPEKSFGSSIYWTPILETWPIAHASQFNVLPKSYMVHCSRLECKDCTKTYIHIVPCIVWCGRLVNIYRTKMKTNSYCKKIHSRLRWIETIKCEIIFDLHKMKTKLHMREIIRNEVTTAVRCLRHLQDVFIYSTNETKKKNHKPYLNLNYCLNVRLYRILIYRTEKSLQTVYQRVVL